MSEWTFDTGVHLTVEVAQSLGKLKELDIELQAGLKKLGEDNLTAKEKEALKKSLVKISEEKIEISKQLEESARQEIKELNKQIKSVSQQLIAHDVTENGFRQSKKSQARKKKSSVVPIVTDEENNIYCICKTKINSDMIECDNEYCKNMWYHTSCIGIREIPEKEWYCQDCLNGNLIVKKKLR